MKVEALHVVLLRLLTLLLVGILIIIWVVSHFTFIIKKGTHQFRLPAFSTYASNIEANGAAHTALGRSRLSSLPENWSTRFARRLESEALGSEERGLE